MFEKILIAGRGEIAARVARTCRRLGADTVAVCADGEEDSVAAQACDAIARIGASEGHSSAAVIVAAAIEHGCQAIHPGYGLFDESLELPRRAEAAGIALIGPSAETLVLHRDRLALREAAIEAGLRVLPASSAAASTEAEVRAEAEAMGYPVIVKRAIGLHEPRVLLAAADQEALDAHLATLELDGAALILERHLDRPRHVEVQIAADGKGHIGVLGDLETSARKDHRRVLGESPAPAIDALHGRDEVRAAIWASAFDLVAYSGFRGVGTVQFLIDARGAFYFVGFVPRLSPEHALVEMCANVDLVEVEVMLALGETVPDAVLRAEPTGHAVQARIDAAMNPVDGKPFPGKADEVRWPPAPTGRVRIESGIHARSRVAAEHDAMVATVTTYAPTRHEAILSLDRVIAETRIAPLVTNLRLLRRALNHESFRACQYDEGFLDRA
jgi:acetyl/propionyl-CoA carboxylase alpha subunit